MITLRAHHRGFSLIEALVALLIIAVGLLGIAGMQALSLNSTSTSRVRALAAVEASNMAAYMAANATYWRNVALPFNATVKPTGTPLGTTASLSTTDNVLLGDFKATDCVTSQCTPVQMAAYDLHQWATNQNPQLALLPGGIGYIASNGTEAGVFTVSVGWRQQRLASNGTGALPPAVTYYRIVVQP